MRSLGALLAEQRSPLELLLFVAIAVVVFLVLSATLYAAIISLLTLRLPARVPLRRVLLPDRKRLMENLGDYLLAVFTSLLLTLTVMQKHELVDEITNYEFREEDKAELARLFDLGLPEKLGADLVDQSVASVVEPVLDAGRPEQAGLLMKTLVVPRVRTGYAWMSPFLLVTCVLLTVAYLAWLARRRFHVLRVDPEGEPEYGKTARGLFTLAVCVGLLLASRVPFAEGSEGLLAESALGAIAYERAEDEPAGAADERVPIERRVAEEIRRQDVYLSLLNCPDCEEPPSSVWTAIAAVSGESTGLGRTLDRRLEDLEARWVEADGRHQREIAELRAAAAAATQRLTELQGALQARDARLAELGRGVEEAQGCCSRLGGEVAGTRDALAETTADLGNLRQAYERQVAALRRQLEQIENGLEQVRQERATFGDQIARLQQAKEREHQALSEGIAAARNALGQIGECCGGFEGLRAQLNRLEERVRRLEQPVVGALAAPAAEEGQR